MLGRMTAFDAWQFIDQTAEKLGVGADARRKWRERGVPHKWRIPILEAAQKARRKLDPRVFDQPPRAAA